MNIAWGACSRQLSSKPSKRKHKQGIFSWRSACWPLDTSIKREIDEGLMQGHKELQTCDQRDMDMHYSWNTSLFSIEDNISKLSFSTLVISKLNSVSVDLSRWWLNKRNKRKSLKSDKENLFRQRQFSWQIYGTTGLIINYLSTVPSLQSFHPCPQLSIIITVYQYRLKFMKYITAGMWEGKPVKVSKNKILPCSLFSFKPQNMQQIFDKN